MKLLILSPQFPSPRFPLGGNIKSGFAIELKKLNVPVKVIVPLPIRLNIFDTLKDSREEFYNGIKTVHPLFLQFPIISSFIPRMQLMFFKNSLNKEVKSFVKNGGRLVHSHSITLAGSAINVFKKKYPLISIVTLHDHEVHQLKTRSKRYHKFLQTEISRVDHLICVSQFQLNELQKFINLNIPYSVIPFGINKPDAVKNLPVNFTISSAGRLVKTKGSDLLIKGVADLIVRKNINIRLNIIGDGPYRYDLQRLANELGVENEITFMGWLSNKETIQAIANSHIFVLPSYQEALGLVYFEAMAVYTPVVAVKGQGIAGYISHGENGFLVEPKSLDSLIEVLEIVVSSKELLSDIASKAYKTYRATDIEWADNAKKHKDLYQRLLKK